MSQEHRDYDVPFPAIAGIMLLLPIGSIVLTAGLVYGAYKIAMNIAERGETDEQSGGEEGQAKRAVLDGGSM